MSYPELWTSLNRFGFEAMQVLLSVTWQSSILFAVALVLGYLLRKRRPIVTRRLWITALLLAPTFPVLSFLLQKSGGPRTPVAVLPAYEQVSRSNDTVAAVARSPARPTHQVSTIHSPEPPKSEAPAVSTEAQNPEPIHLSDYPWALALLFYAAGSGSFFAFIVIGRLRLRRWIRASRRPTDERVRKAFLLSSSLSPEPVVGEADCVPTPLSTGIIHPWILLPTGLADRLSDEELDAVAAHETAHLLRSDPLVLTLVALIRAVLFYHPLVWLAARRVSILTEQCADEAVIEATREPLTYAKLLSRLAEGMPPHPFATEVATGILFSKGAFLDRVERILRDRSRVRRLPAWAGWGLFLAVLVGIGTAAALPLGRSSPQSPDETYEYSVPGMKIDIELIGVVPDGGDEIFAPDGNALGEAGEFYAPYPDEKPHWNEDEVRRDFILRLPDTDEQTVYLSAFAVPEGSPGGGPPLSTLKRNLFLSWRSGTTVPVVCLFAKDPYYSRGAARAADLYVHYYHGERGEPDAVFTGPFPTAATVSDDAGSGYFLVTNYAGDISGFNRGVILTVRSDRPLRFHMPLIVYDRDGNWHPGVSRGGDIESESRSSSIGTGVHVKTPNPTRNELHYHFPDLTPYDLVRVAFNEKPNTKVFRGVNIHFSDLPDRSQSAWIDRVADRLNLESADTETILHYDFDSRSEAIRLLDVVRDYHMMQQAKDVIVSRKTKPENHFDEKLEKVPTGAREWVRSPDPAIPPEAIQPVDLIRDHWAISKAKPESQLNEELEKVRSVAREWLRSPDPAVRTFAVQLGLEWASWPEFIDPALDLATLSFRSVGAAARPLAFCNPIMEKEQIARVKDILLVSEDPRIVPSLLHCLQWHRDGPNREVSLRALRELAESDKPWLWWGALQDSWLIRYLKEEGEFNDPLQLRLTMISLRNPDYGQYLDNPERYREEALQSLPDILKVEQRGKGHFMNAYLAYLFNIDSETGTGFLASFLRELLAEWNGRQIQPLLESEWWFVDTAARVINHWHATDIGGLGDDIERQTLDTGSVDWRVVAEEAITVAEARDSRILWDGL